MAIVLSALQYDKIETNLQFVSSKIAFMKEDDPKEEIILHKITETEGEDMRNKGMESFIYSELCSISLSDYCPFEYFSFIKRLKQTKRRFYCDFNVKNEIRYIQFHFRKHSNTLVSEKRTVCNSDLCSYFSLKNPSK